MPDTDRLLEAVRYSRDQPADPDQPRRIATHGPWSATFYHRIRHALNLAPALTGHIVSMRAMATKGGDRVQTSGDPAAPFNVTAVDDADHVYKVLTYWALLFAEKLAVRPPRSGIGRRVDGQIEGFASNTSPQAAHEMIRGLSAWYSTWLEQIMRTDPADVEAFGEEMREVFRLNARWPMEERARYSQLPCPDDRHRRDETVGRIAFYPPQAHGDEQIIKCEGCGRYFDPEDYARLIELFVQVAEEEAKAKSKIGRHLTRKYA